MSCSNHERNSNASDDDNSNHNRRPPPTNSKDENTEESNDEEPALDDCGSQNPSLGGLVSQILAHSAGNSNPFNTNPRPVPRNSEERRVLLTSILQDAVRICSDEDFAPSSTNSQGILSSSNFNSQHADHDKQNQPDLQ